MPKRRKQPTEPPKPEFPKSFETFRKFETYHQNDWTSDVPTCLNGWVRVRRYRITVELIEEPIEVIHERLKKLWRESDNYHHHTPLRAEAKKYGLELNAEEYGKDAPKRK